MLHNIKYHILLIGLFLINCSLGCSVTEEDKVVIEDFDVLFKIEKLPIDKRIFEALKQNYPSVIRGLFATADEFYGREPKGFQERERDLLKRLTIEKPEEEVPWPEIEKSKEKVRGSSIERSEENVRDFTIEKPKDKAKEVSLSEFCRPFKKLREVCEKKGLVWRDSFLAKTTCRRHIDEEDEDFDPAKPRWRNMCLNISDGKTSVIIIAEIYYLHQSGKPMLWSHLIFDPFTSEERKMLHRLPSGDKKVDRNVIDMLIKHKTSKDFILCWIGGPDNPGAWFGIPSDLKSNKWIYRHPPSILKIYFSSDGYVSDVVITKE
jgi:hypothetical protein